MILARIANYVTPNAWSLPNDIITDIFGSQRFTAGNSPISPESVQNQKRRREWCAAAAWAEKINHALIPIVLAPSETMQKEATPIQWRAVCTHILGKCAFPMHTWRECTVGCILLMLCCWAAFYSSIFLLNFTGVLRRESRGRGYYHTPSQWGSWWGGEQEFYLIRVIPVA